MEAHYIGFNMWANAVTKAGTTDVDAVRAAMYGQEFPNLSGGTAMMLPNHHLGKPVLIGEIRADGQFEIITRTEEVAGDAWTDFLPESAVLVSDWKRLGCGMYNVKKKHLPTIEIKVLISNYSGATIRTNGRLFISPIWLREHLLSDLILEKPTI